MRGFAVLPLVSLVLSRGGRVAMVSDLAHLLDAGCPTGRSGFLLQLPQVLGCVALLFLLMLCTHLSFIPAPLCSLAARPP